MSRALNFSEVARPIFVVIDSMLSDTFNYTPVKFDKKVLLPDPSWPIVMMVILSEFSLKIYTIWDSSSVKELRLLLVSILDYIVVLINGYL